MVKRLLKPLVVEGAQKAVHWDIPKVQTEPSPVQVQHRESHTRFLHLFRMRRLELFIHVLLRSSDPLEYELVLDPEVVMPKDVRSFKSAGAFKFCFFEINSLLKKQNKDSRKCPLSQIFLTDTPSVYFL